MATVGTKPAAVLAGFVVKAVTAGAAIGCAYGVLLVAVASFGENTPGSTFFVDALLFAIPSGTGFGVAIGVLAGTACGLVFAALAAARLLPPRGGSGAWPLPLVAGAVTLGVARFVLGLFYEPGMVFVWGPAGVSAVTAATIGYHLLPSGGVPPAQPG